jgi:hypothetical protein
MRRDESLNTRKTVIAHWMMQVNRRFDHGSWNLTSDIQMMLCHLEALVDGARITLAAS